MVCVGELIKLAEELERETKKLVKRVEVLLEQKVVLESRIDILEGWLKESGL